MYFELSRIQKLSCNPDTFYDAVIRIPASEFTIFANRFLERRGGRVNHDPIYNNIPGKILDFPIINFIVYAIMCLSAVIIIFPATIPNAFVYAPKASRKGIYRTIVN